MHSQNKILVGSLALTILMVSGCKPATQAPDPATPVAIQANTPTTATGQTVLELASSDPKVRTQVGVKEQGVLVATGKGGVLAFGPYQQMAAGKYFVSVRGSTSTPFALDVASDAGKTVHARKHFAARESNEALATLPFELTAPVQHLEIRLMVPEGSDTKLVGYKVVAQ